MNICIFIYLCIHVPVYQGKFLEVELLRHRFMHIFPKFYYETFQQTKEMREFYSAHLYTHQLDSTVNILLYFFF